MKKGSITIFLALVFVLVLSFLFSLLEGARVHCLNARAQLVSEVCMQSVFGNFHAGLWEDYHLLFLDGSWQDGDFSVEKLAQRAMYEAEQNLTSVQRYAGADVWNLTQLTATNVDIENYELATDDKGKVFQRQVSQQMQQEIVADTLEELLWLKEQGETAESQRDQKESSWEQAWDAMEEAKEQEAKEEKEPEGITVPTETDYENPMPYVKELKKFSVLALVLDNPSELSGKAILNRNTLMDRRLQEGDWQQNTKSEITDRLLLQYYIQNYFSNYTAESSKGAKEKILSYEMEYLIGGKESDGENLEVVVYELLAVREALNFVTIMKDTEKQNLALGIATAAVGFTGVVPLVKAVQIGILLAWAFVESVLDVRALLKGGKVPFLKGTDQWSSDLDSRESIENNTVAKEDKEGLTYTQYLQMLLFLLSEKTINYRCMDLIEQNEQIRMDNMIQAVKATYEYQAKPLFWNVNFLKQKDWDSLSVSVTSSVSYGTN